MSLVASVTALTPIALLVFQPMVGHARCTYAEPAPSISGHSMLDGARGTRVTWI